MTTVRRWMLVAVAGLASVGALAACNDDDGVAGPVPVALVEVTPALGTIEVGKTLQLSAEVTDANGNALNYSVTWSGDAYASVDSKGLVTGVAPGLATITATSGGKSGSAAVKVEEAVASIELSQTTATVVAGQSIKLTATPKDADGEAITRAVTWSSSDTKIVSVSSDGMLTGVAPGTAKVTATSGDKSVEAEITVVPPVASITLNMTTGTLLTAETVQLTATLKDASGAELTRTVAWQSDAPAVAIVDANGLVTALTPGTATITATCEGLLANAVITVKARVAAVAVTPAQAEILIGETVKLTATLTDADGNVLDRPVEWTSNDPNIASVDATGLVTGNADGTVTIVATSGGKIGSATIAVKTPVATVAVAAPADSIEITETLQFTATARDGAGNVMDVAFTWHSSDEGVATVDANGLVTPVAPGTTTISARHSVKSGGKAIIVMIPVNRIAVTPEGGTINAGTSLRLTAAALDASGTSLNRVISWKSSNSAVAAVDQTGLVTSGEVGSATITASAGGKEKAVQLTVREPVATVEVTAPSDSVIVGRTLQLTAIAKNGAGVVLNRPAEWSSSDGAKATVNASGLVTALAKGPVTITATVDGIAAQMQLSVKAAVATISVDWPTRAVTEEGASVFADLRDSDGNQLIRQVIWTSTNTSVLAVTPLTAVTAHLDYKGSGTATITATVEGKVSSATLEAKGPPSGGEEEVGNNLSYPTIFADGLTIAGVPVGTDAGLRPLATENIVVDALPFWYSGNVADWLGTHFLQGGTNTWRAEWSDGTSGAHNVSVKWGDNILGHTWNTGTPIRVEVGLTVVGGATMKGFNMFVLSGSGQTEIQGTDGSIADFTPALFTSSARLRVEKLDAEGGNPIATAFEGSIADQGLTAEVNAAGKIIYGYQLQLSSISLPPGVAKDGWYRLSFILDDQTTVGGHPVQRNVTIVGAPAGETYAPKIDSEGRRCYLDIQITP